MEIQNVSLCFQLGVDGVKADTMPVMAKYFIRGMPLIMFPFISNFPAVGACVFKYVSQ